MSRTIIDRVKTRLADAATTISDDLLQDLIDDAEGEVLARTSQPALNPALERVVVGLVVISVNRLGTEGIASEGYSGVSTAYLDDLSPNLKSIIYANTRLGSWGDSDEST
ncbi:phage head-tail connector protein [Enterococcus saccharolyticus]|uniref:phage head-tail connector protein n=1 Tax=Enterococcus saccharolyticus TaxID=41997 RepID=UPI003AEFCC6F